MTNFPQNIICITEESVEFLYAIGQEDRIIGVSAYVKRPVEAQKKPVVSAFVNGNINKISALKPDLVLGHSDVQADLAAKLIKENINVFIANHRSVSAILDYLTMLGNMVNEREKTDVLINKLNDMINEARKKAMGLKVRPKIYIEEWNEPMISGIEWFSEIVEICGGDVVFRKKSFNKKSQDRVVTHFDFKELNLDIILACWCGKKVDINSIKQRDFLKNTNAIKNSAIFELEPEIFLQPGMAPIISGIPIISQIIENWSNSFCFGK